jgi:hypothetical protein
VVDEKLREYGTARQIAYLEALDAHGSLRLAADALGVSKGVVGRSLQALRKKAAIHGYAPGHGWNNPVPDGFKTKRISTLTDIQSGQDKLQWNIAEPDRERQLELIQIAFEAMAEDLPKLPPFPAPNEAPNAALMSVIPWGDPHFGLYCWADEVGQDFDLTTAKRDLCAAVDYLVSQSAASERCVLINLGDFFNADTPAGTTTKGTRLDMAGRLPEIIKVGVAAIRQCIESGLSRHKTVEIINAIGNHDEVTSMALSVMLANIYENESRVIVHAAPTWRHYIKHGKTLIGVVHGDKTKDRDLPGIMATERPQWWGETTSRYFYRGHQHHDQKDEFAGCIVEQFRTLAPGDAWTVSHGFLSGQDMKLIVHHAEWGEVARSTCSVQMLRDLRLAKE